MDLDFMTAPVIDEFGNAENDNTIGEYIMNSLEEYDEEDNSSSIFMTMQGTMSKVTKRVEIHRTTPMNGRIGRPTMDPIIPSR